MQDPSRSAANARRWLFVPGHSQRRVEKALSLLEQEHCERVIIDWEDAVPADCKSQARATTARLLESLSPEQRLRVVVRIHGASTAEFSVDVEALSGWLVGAVVLPKAESAQQLVEAAELELPIIGLVESALGVEQSFEIASADPWVRGLAVGPLDLLADLELQWRADSPALAFARQRVVYAARAAKLRQILMGPYPDLEDEDGLEADTKAGREMGFTGRLLIHPKQLAPTARAFGPNEQDVAFARRVVSAWAQRGSGQAAIRVDGRFVDPPVVRWAEQLLVHEPEDQTS